MVKEEKNQPITVQLMAKPKLKGYWAISEKNSSKILCRGVVTKVIPVQFSGYS